MKKFTLFKIMILLTAALWLTQNVQGQVNDTLVVKISSTLLIKVTDHNLPGLLENKQVDSLILQFQKEFSSIKSHIKKQNSYHLYWLQDNYLKVDSLTSRQIFTFENHALIQTPARNVCELSPLVASSVHEKQVSTKILIYFTNLNELTNPIITSYVDQALQKIRKPSRYAKNWYYDINDQEESFAREEITSTKCMDKIELSAGMGAALIKNTGMVNLDFTLGISLGSRSRIKHKIFLTDEMNYIFTTNSSFTINNFLSLGYSHNFSENPDKPRWYGLEAGFLTNKKTNFFDTKTDTYRIGLIVNPIMRIHVKPFLYFENDFQKVYPGIGFTFDF